MPDFRDYIRRHLQLTRLQPARQAEIVEDLAQQLDEAYQEALAQGAKPADAEQAARRHISDWEALSAQLDRSPRGVQPQLERLAEQMPSGRPWQSAVSGFLRDLHFGLRMMRKNPVFSAVVVLTLALGIGANTAIFSVVNGVMLRPLTYPQAERMVILSETGQRSGQAPEPISVSWQDYLDWKEQGQSFEAMGVYRLTNSNVTGDQGAERLVTGIVASDVFRAAAIPPLMGRAFNQQEDTTNAAPVVILSERVWRGRYAASPGILSRTIVLDGRNYSVVGVMPSSMRFPSRTTDVWVPLGLFVASMPPSRGAHPNLGVVARLKQHVTVAQAQSEMETIGRRLAQQYPDSNAMVAAHATSFYELVVGGIRRTLQALLIAVALVLLIACVNLANMLLARGEARSREVAVRAALGASPGQLVRQFLAESLLLSLFGGTLGVGVAWLALHFLVQASPSFVPRLDQIGIDLTALLFTAGVSFLVSILFGLWPALRVSAMSSRASFKDVTSTSSRRSRLRPLLVSAEVGLAMVLLIAAGLMIRTFERLASIELGFDPEHVVTMRVTLPAQHYPTPEKGTVFFVELLRKMSEARGVRVAGVSSLTPLGGGGSESDIFPEGAPLDPSHSGPGCTFGTVSGGYFQAMGITLLKGRTFNDHDTGEATPVLIVDELAAQTFWPGQDPIGKRAAFEYRGHSRADPQPVWREVVGVVRRVKHYDLTTPTPRVQVYIPVTQPSIWTRLPLSMSLMVRSDADPASMVASVRQQLAGLDPELPVFGVRTMSGFVDDALEQPRISMAVMVTFSALALLLAVIGIYGVLSYSVSQRTREIGIRVALGATRAAILRFIMGQGVVIAGAGVAAGLLVSLAVMRLIRDLLYGVTPTDRLTYVVIPLLLFVVALCATFIPARRATRVDPLTALRYE
jgi:putative ABC transport system permease protein